jgi:hypothetical protein
VNFREAVEHYGFAAAVGKSGRGAIDREQCAFLKVSLAFREVDQVLPQLASGRFRQRQPNTFALKYASQLTRNRLKELAQIQVRGDSIVKIQQQPKPVPLLL